MCQVPQTLERLHDVQLALVDLSFSLNEIHLELLNRALTNFTGQDFTGSQDPLHSLKLGDDVITSEGKDMVVGDSSVLYFQIDSAAPGFEFALLASKDVDSKIMTNIMNTRQGELDLHVVEDLQATSALTNSEKSALAYWDVPFYISVGNDNIDLYDNDIIAVGDFATLGIAFSTTGDIQNMAALRKYSDSIEILRRSPSTSSFFPRLSLYTMEFYHTRYDSAKTKQVKPTLHGDFFEARSSKNVVFGDFLSAAMGSSGTGDDLSLDSTTFYGLYQNAAWAQFFDDDTMTVTSGGTSPYWAGQTSTDIVFGTVQKGETDTFVTRGMERIFNENGLTKQVKSDLNAFAVPYNVTGNITLGPVCNDGFSYVPSHTWSVYLVDAPGEAILRSPFNQSDNGIDGDIDGGTNKGDGSVNDNVTTTTTSTSTSSTTSDNENASTFSSSTTSDNGNGKGNGNSMLFERKMVTHDEDNDFAQAQHVSYDEHLVVDNSAGKAESHHSNLRHRKHTHD